MSRTPTLEPGQVKMIGLNHITPDPDQIRTIFDPVALDELAADIKQRGIEQPITVRTNGGTGFIIKHGERRYRAAQLIKLDKVPVILAKADRSEGADLKRLFDQYAENMQREDLNPIDLAHFFKRLRDEYKKKVSEIPALLDENGIKAMSRSYISNFIRLIELPDWAQDYLKTGKLTPSHAKHLLPALESEPVMNQMHTEIETTLNDQNDDREPLTEHIIKDMVFDAFDDHHPRVDRSYGDDGAVYDYDKLSKEDLARLNARKISTPYGASGVFALNQEVHDELNKKAKGQGKKTGSQRRTPDDNKSTVNGTTVTAKTEANFMRLRDHLQGFLTRWILAHIETLTTAPSDFANDVRARLLLWIAVKSPNGKGHDEKIAWHHRDELSNHGADEALDVIKYHHLVDFLTGTTPPAKIITAIVTAAIKDASLGTICRLANHLGIDLVAAYRIDQDYVEMFTKLGLAKLVKTAALQDEELWRQCKKAGEMQAFCVNNAEAIGLPADVRECYEGQIIEDDTFTGVDDGQDELEDGADDVV